MFSLLVLVISVTIIVCLGVYICKVCTVSISSFNLFNTKRVHTKYQIHYKLFESLSGTKMTPPSLLLQLSVFFSFNFDLVELIVAHIDPVHLLAHISLVYLVATIDPVYIVAQIDPIILSAQAPVQVDTVQDKRSHITGSNDSCQLSSTVCKTSKPGNYIFAISQTILFFKGD